jgi:ribosomal-protein-alanine N-acetyltransferase
MDCLFAPMTADAARAIQAWRYDGPYAVYNSDAAPDAPLDPEWLDARSPYFAARDATTDDLVGFGCRGTAALPWDSPTPRLTDDQGFIALGLGLRPDHTGRGLGLGFVQTLLAFITARYHPAGFVLYVLAFNQRAIRVYARAGFSQTRTLHITNIYGALDFVEMRKESAHALSSPRGPGRD